VAIKTGAGLGRIAAMSTDGYLLAIDQGAVNS